MMYLARISLICLIAFAFMVGCGMTGKKAEMPEAATGSMAGEMMEAEKKADMMEAEKKADMMEAEAMTEVSLEEVTLTVTGMT